MPGGDEPHYLVITQSLLKDHDLRIENNHRRGDYQPFFAGELPKPDFRRRGRDGEIYSIHAPGLPTLVAPAFAVGGYHGVLVFLILLASIGSALAWHLAERVTGRQDAAWFGWAAVTLSATWIFHTFTVYPDGAGAVVTLTGVWALLRADEESRTASERAWPWLLHGAALALLPWLHTRFAFLAGSLGGLVLLRLARTPHAPAKAVALLAAPAVAAVAWIGYFVAIYGTPDPTAPYADEAGSIAFIPAGIAGLIADQRFGLFVYAPVLLFAFTGVGAMLRRPATRRLALELLFVAVPYLLAVTHFAMWWGGTSAPARFFVPLLLPLTIPAAVAWTAIARRATRVTACAALVFTVFASAILVLVDGGRLAFNDREGDARWLGWMNGAADLARGVPSWWEGRDIHALLLLRDAVIWVVAITGAWLALAWLARHARTRGALVAAAGALYAAAAMLALSVVWHLHGVDGANVTQGRLQVLRRLGDRPRAIVVALYPAARLSAAALPPMLRMMPERATIAGGAGQNDRPLYVLPGVPAGRYRLVPRTVGEGGWLMVGIGRDQFSLRSGPIPVPPQPIVLDFPVDVRAIVVRGDEQARRIVSGLDVEPMAIVPPRQRLSPEYARKAVRYGPSTVYFLDERSFPEPEAFWIGGARRSSIVLQPDTAGSTATLFVRNAPVDNQLTLETGAWREDARLAPGEERRIQVPLDRSRGATLITFTSASGFRPSAVDPASRDARFLGVWVHVQR